MRSAPWRGWFSRGRGTTAGAGGGSRRCPAPCVRSPASPVASRAPPPPRALLGAALPLLQPALKPAVRFVDITLHDNVTASFAESRALLARLGIGGEIVPTPGHSDDSVSLVLDDGSAFTGDLTPPGLALETDRAQ